MYARILKFTLTWMVVAKLKQVENKSGWKLTAADGSLVTLTHGKDIHVTFQPSSWITESNAPASNLENSTVDLQCTASNFSSSAIKQFFFSFLSTKAKSLVQHETRASNLLSLIRSGWDLCQRLEAAAHSLELGGLTDATVISEEKVALDTTLYLSMLETKIRIRYGISVLVTDAFDVQARVKVIAKVVYGEKYDEPKMMEFLSQYVEDLQVTDLEGVRKWAAGVEDLRGRLIRRGRKNVRV